MKSNSIENTEPSSRVVPPRANVYENFKYYNILKTGVLLLSNEKNLNYIFEKKNVFLTHASWHVF